MTHGDAPALTGRVDLDASAVAEFEREGHCLVRGLASTDEVAAYRPLIEEAALRTAWDRRPLEERDTYGKAFLQSFNLWRTDEALARFSLSPRFASVAAQLLGVEAVRMYHDQALIKEVGGGRTPWHQDQYYWPLDTDRTVSMWMPLADLSPEVGSMTFVSGSHRMGDLRGHAISDESDAEFASMILREGLRTASHGPLRAGDATFHSGWTVHSAAANPTDLTRSVMTVIYVADGTRVKAQLSPEQEFDRMMWLGGAEPGAPVHSELNPVIR